jgi:glycerophosphoryl diester phosphodiesterase
MTSPAWRLWPYPFWIAHRGAGRNAPENTLAAFEHGWQQGFRMCECDVKLSADGVPYLLHDDTLDRTSNGHGPVGSLTWEDLACLDAGRWHSAAYAGEPLLRLDTLMAWCGGRGAALNIEIKPVPGEEAHTGERVARAVRSGWTGPAGWPLLTSFRPEALQAAALAAPEIPRGLLLEQCWPGWERAAQALGCVALVCHHALVDPDLVAQTRRQGWRLLVYTVNDDRALQRLLPGTVDGVITDRMDWGVRPPACDFGSV